MIKTIGRKQSNFLRKLNYRRFSTPADIGLEVWGEDLSMLFQNAARGLLFLLFGNRIKQLSNYKQIDQQGSLQLAGDCPEDLLVKMLSEILFLLDHRRKIFVLQQVLFDKQNITCHGFFIENRWSPLLEIKAVTYHNLQLTVKGKRYYIKIVFDL